jgi:hypothetical protein
VTGHTKATQNVAHGSGIVKLLDPILSALLSNSFAY